MLVTYGAESHSYVLDRVDLDTLHPDACAIFKSQLQSQASTDKIQGEYI